MSTTGADDITLAIMASSSSLTTLYANRSVFSSFSYGYNVPACFNHERWLKEGEIEDWSDKNGEEFVVVLKDGLTHTTADERSFLVHPEAYNWSRAEGVQVCSFVKGNYVNATTLESRCQGGSLRTVLVLYERILNIYCKEESHGRYVFLEPCTILVNTDNTIGIGSCHLCATTKRQSMASFAICVATVCSGSEGQAFVSEVESRREGEELPRGVRGSLVRLIHRISSDRYGELHYRDMKNAYPTLFP